MRQLAAKVAIATLVACVGCAQGDRLVADYDGAAGGSAAGGSAAGGSAAGGSAAGGASGAGGGATFSVPVLVPGLRASDIDVHDPSLTGDELEIFFASDVEGVSEIWTSTRASAADPWAPAVRVAELSSAEDDIDPDVSPDGSTLYLSSNRGALGYQLFVSRRIGRSEPWSTPEAVVGIPTTHYNLAPSVDPAGLLMVFAMQTAGPDQIFLYSAARSTTSDAWGAVEPLTSIASAYQDQKPALFDNGRGLVFSSRRTDQGRTSDLFVTTRADRTKPWGAPSAIPALDTDSWEGDPWVSQDGGHILFVSNRNDGVSRIYEAWR